MCAQGRCHELCCHTAAEADQGCSRTYTAAAETANHCGCSYSACFLADAVTVVVYAAVWMGWLPTLPHGALQLLQLILNPLQPMVKLQTISCKSHDIICTHQA